MKKTGSQYRKLIIITVVLCGVFVASVLLEEFLRATQAVSIPIDSSEVPEVTITASRKPDFLWLGTAWRINYESPVPFDLDLGNGSASEVPAGKHKIFANHDYSNLDQYGLKLSKDFPESIVVQSAKSPSP